MKAYRDRDLIYSSQQHYVRPPIIIPVLRTRKLRPRDDCDQLKSMLLVSAASGFEPCLSSSSARAFATTLSSVIGVTAVCLPPCPAGLKVFRRQGDSRLPCRVSAGPTSTVSSTKKMPAERILCFLDLTEGIENQEVLPKILRDVRSLQKCYELWLIRRLSHR